MRIAAIVFIHVLCAAALWAQPIINLEPDTLDFGTVGGGNTRTLFINLANIGTDLLEGTIDAAIGDGFSLISETTFNLANLDSPFAVAVAFTPQLEQAYEETLRIASNDPVHSNVEVPLYGIGGAAQPGFDLLLPADMTPISELPITFTWDTLERPSTVTYELTLFVDTDPLIPPLRIPNIPFESYAFAGRLFVFTPYRWYVTGYWDSQSRRSDTTHVFFFNGEASFDLLYPPDHADLGGLDFEQFMWQPVNARDAANYALIVRQLPNGTEGEFGAGENTTYTLDLTALPADAEFEWYVNCLFGIRQVQSDHRRTFTTGISGVGTETAMLPMEFDVTVYPNPFNPETSIHLAVPQSGFVKAEIFDVLGRRAESLFNGTLPAGIHQLAWRPYGPSGLYFLHVTAPDGSVQIHRLELLK